MTPERINQLFQEHINNKQSIKNAQITRQTVYNYRNREISIGAKIEFLYLAGVIKLTENEPKTKA